MINQTVMIHADVLVIGSGISGLIYSIKLAQENPDKSIIIVTKSVPEESNTKYAQGGIAVVWDRDVDDFDKHIEDTLRAGAGLCNRSVVEIVVRDAPTCIQELLDWGVDFDKNNFGKYDLGREGGHSHNRVIHHQDNTGEVVENVLLNKVESYKNISILSFHQALDLIIDNNQCFGAYVLDIKSNKVETIKSQITLIATGGCGHIYENTTNPLTSTGDGIALGYRAGCEITGMQFIQFHPTAIYEEAKGRLSLVSEALRGAGAKLLTKSKEPFMHKYDSREELASRDIVSRAIYTEMQCEDSPYVYLDCRHIDKDILLSHFPNIYKDCMDRGIHLEKDLLPIVPACHYLCGGIDVDMDAQTSIANLFAVGECTNSGLHGANRLASNSLLEALVYGRHAALKSTEILRDDNVKTYTKEIKEYSAEEKNNSIERYETIKSDLASAMSKYVSISRSYSGLQTVKDVNSSLKRNFDSIYNPSHPSLLGEETRNLLCVASLVVKQSISQKQNAGTYYNTDLI